MTRARDIANLVDANGDIVAGALDNVPASNDASALSTGTLAAARLPSSGVDAASITTGTLNSARVSLANSDITGHPFSVRQINTIDMWSNIAHGANNGNSYGYFYSNVAIGSYTTSDTFALMVRIYYTHGGSADHGYLGGYVVQAGETDAFPNRADFYMSHYDDYYNSDCSELLMKWNPSGTQSMRFYVNSSHNTNSNNSYAIRLVGTLERA